MLSVIASYTINSIYFTLVRLWTLMDSNFWTRDTTCVTIKETVNSIR